MIQTRNVWRFSHFALLNKMNKFEIIYQGGHASERYIKFIRDTRLDSYRQRKPKIYILLVGVGILDI